MRTFRCPRCGHTDQAIATQMAHPCPMPKPADELPRLVRRLTCDRQEVAVVMVVVEVAA